MEIHEVQAYVLQKHIVSETKCSVTCLSRERGRFNGWIQLKGKKKSQILYEPFLPLWLVLETRQNWIAIKTIELQSQTSRLIGDALWCGWYLNELLMYLLPPDEINFNIYDLYTETLNALAQAHEKTAYEIILRRFEWHLLTSLGMGISLTHEAQGKGAISAARFYQCRPGLGLIESTSGISGEVILGFASGNWAARGVLKGAKQLMRMLIEHALEGRELKTRTLFRRTHVTRET